MAQKWFVQVNETIDGPFTKEDVEARLQAGQLSSQNLVWGLGMEHWRSLNWWATEGQNPMNHETTQVTATSETAREVWHYALAGESRGPFQRKALIDELKKCGALGDVLLWTKGMKEWAPLFEFHDILSAIGVNKRQFPRADITGQVTIKTNTGQTLVAPALTISEGGMGVQLDTGLTAGMSVNLQIDSPAFGAAVQAKAEVRFQADGVTGLRFSNISSESKSAIVALVRQNQTRFVLKAS